MNNRLKMDEIVIVAPLRPFFGNFGYILWPLGPTILEMDDLKHQKWTQKAAVLNTCLELGIS